MTPLDRGATSERRIGKRAEQKRRDDHKRYGRNDTCVCGQPKMTRSEFCPGCRREILAEQHRERCSYIHSCWHAGMTLAEIANGLESTANSIGTEMAHMRRDGWDLPKRGNNPRGLTRPRA